MFNTALSVITRRPGFLSSVCRIDQTPLFRCPKWPLARATMRGTLREKPPLCPPLWGLLFEKPNGAEIQAGAPLRSLTTGITRAHYAALLNVINIDHNVWNSTGS
jgi:hypothetical protein